MFNQNVFKTLFSALFFPLMIILLISGCGSNQSTDEVEQPEIVSNNQPIANAGIDQQATTGETIFLDASASTDSDGDTIGFSWSLITIPDGSNAILINPDDTNASFVADLEGNYVVSLVVNDGSFDSASDTVAIFVSPETATTTLSDGSIVETAALVVIGNLIYHDTNLSTPIGQSCASCHDLSTGFDDPNSSNPTSVGADGVSFGTRNSPTASYAALIPAPQNQGNGQGQLVGGLFLDGRAASLEEQAKGPFLNPVEMGNENAQQVIDKLSSGSYAAEFESLFGEGILADAERSYEYLADAISAFERTDIFSPFNSKFDQVSAGNENFTASELRGQTLFSGKADCDRCHSDNGDVVVFSDFEYENIGVPSNPFLPAFINDPTFVDLGLGAETGQARNNGQFRTPNLRNIAITAPYMHNGVFNTLEEVVDFYNTRDSGFPDAPEVDQNIDQGGQIGELNLTANEITDLIAFLNTFTDR